MSINKTCEVCKFIFKAKPSQSDKQFCSMKCYHVARTKKSRKPCPICGQEMRAWMDYCSRICSAKSLTKNIDVNCQQCKNSFSVKPYRAKIAKFCSAKCALKCRVCKIKSKIKKNCQECGEEFEISQGAENKELKRSGFGKRFCSNLCVGKNKSKQYGYEGINRICESCGCKFTVDKPCVKTKRCSHICGAKMMWKDHNEKMENLLPTIKEYRKTHSPDETGEKFGYSASGLRQLGVFGPEKEKRLSCPDKLTVDQEETIIGNLLGDGCIYYIKDTGGSRGGYNSHFSIGQKGDRAEYVNGLYDIYSPFSCGISKVERRKPSRVDGKINHDIENWNGEYTNSIMMYTVAHPIFNELRKKWYKEPSGKRSLKIIPRDLRLSWRTAAFWMCDDGTNYCGKRNRSLTLYTDCFTLPDVEFLVDRIYKDLGISARINFRDGKPNIKIYGDEWFNFIEGIKPFIPYECFQYKCVNRQKMPPNIEALRDRRIECGKKNLASALEKRGWELLSEYTDRKMQIRCEHGKVFTRIRSTLIRSNAKCDCIPNNIDVINRAKNKFLNLFASKNWELISDYKGFFKYVKLRCQHGKEFERLPGNVKINSKCDCEKLTKSGLQGVQLMPSGMSNESSW